MTDSALPSICMNQDTSLCIYSDLLLPRRPGFTWKSLGKCQSHDNNCLWARYELLIPSGATELQLTAYANHETEEDVRKNNPGAFMARVAGWSIEDNYLYVTVSWFADPWTLYVGWKIDEEDSPSEEPPSLESEASAEAPVEDFAPNNTPSGEESPVGGVLHLGDTLFDALNSSAVDDDNAMGKVFSNLFRSVKKMADDASNDALEGEGFNTDKFLGLLGLNAEDRASITRRQEIETFFKEQLQSIGMKDAIILTKERYNLPDDFTIRLTIEVSFGIANDVKTHEPNVD